MIILITGASHSGKTVLAQKLLEYLHYPYLSIDHLKMGLIRSEQTNLTPESDDAALTAYLWQIVREIIKTAIENEQNLIVEGCYIPFDWQNDFPERYAEHIKYVCLILSESYIKNNFPEILAHANDIETRLHDSPSIDSLIGDNAEMLGNCLKYGLEHVLVEDDWYEIVRNVMAKINREEVR